MKTLIINGRSSLCATAEEPNASMIRVEQAHSIFYILQDYSSLTLVERRGGWVLEVVVVVGEQETDYYLTYRVHRIYSSLQALLSQLYSVTQPLIC